MRRPLYLKRRSLWNEWNWYFLFKQEVWGFRVLLTTLMTHNHTQACWFFFFCIHLNKKDVVTLQNDQVCTVPSRPLGLLLFNVLSCLQCPSDYITHNHPLIINTASHLRQTPSSPAPPFPLTIGINKLLIMGRGSAGRLSLVRFHISSSKSADSRWWMASLEAEARICSPCLFSPPPLCLVLKWSICLFEFFYFVFVKGSKK